VAPACASGPATYPASSGYGSSDSIRFVVREFVEPGQGANVTVSPGATSATTDDVYTITYSVPLTGFSYAQSFSGLVSGADALGSFRRTSGAGGQTFSLYDFGSTLGGSLDYAQLGGFTRQQGTANPAYGYFAYGRETLAAAMPTTGTVTFLGRSRGHGSTGLVLFESASTVSMTVNFANGTITGVMSGFQTQNFQIANPQALDLQFSGSIVPGTSRFRGTAQSSASGGIGLRGEIAGAFLSADGAGPDEVGLTYSLDNTPVQVFGVSVLQKQ